MYLDKLYTKLYSDSNWDGLRQLLTEVKIFARKDYKDLTEAQATELRNLRNKVAAEIAKKRSINQGYEFINKRLDNAFNDLSKGSSEGGSGITDSDVKNQISEFLLTQLNENKKNAADSSADINKLHNLGNKITGNYRKNKLGSKWNPFRTKITSDLSKSDRDLLGL